MANSVKAYESAPHSPMVGAALAARFWAVVEDCLVKFHDLSRGDAAISVTDYWRRLANLKVSSPFDEEDPKALHKYDDMIYHEEPWNIACNLAGRQIPIEPNRVAYRGILRCHHLM